MEKEKGKRRRVPSRDAMLLRMASLCASSEQCSRDIHAKVLKAGLSAHDAEEVVGYLIRNRYVDDRRFAKAFATDKVRFSQWGRMKIRVYLRAKIDDSKAVDAAMDAIDEEDYIFALRKALMAKARTVDAFDAKGRASLYRHLVGRGFESQLVVNEIKAYLKDASRDS